MSLSLLCSCDDIDPELHPVISTQDAAKMLAIRTFITVPPARTL